MMTMLTRRLLKNLQASSLGLRNIHLEEDHEDEHGDDHEDSEDEHGDCEDEQDCGECVVLQN